MKGKLVDNRYIVKSQDDVPGYAVTDTDRDRVLCDSTDYKDMCLIANALNACHAIRCTKDYLQIVENRMGE